MMIDFWRKIKKGHLSPIYLLYGTEPFLINETHHLIIQSAVREEEREFNLSVYDCEETPVEIALEDAETLPFFGDKKVVLVKNPYFLTAEKGKEKIEHNMKRLEQYIEEPSPFSVVIFTGLYEKLDERKKMTKMLLKRAEVFAASPLNEQEIRQWIAEYLRASNVTIQEEAVDLLLQLAGTALTILTNELNKLALFVGYGGTITEETVRLLVPRSLEQNVFVLIEKVVQRKLHEAFRTFYDLLQNNEEPIKILALLANQFRLIYHAKGLAAKGYGQQQIASLLKVHPFRVKMALEQAKLFSLEELMRIINDLAEADYQMKAGLMDKRLVVELFLMKLSEGR
ncbi:DNA polymerase III delta subunit [Anoxybacillus vitaminiphilus]|uniref:DNA polymerase III subunit delta n=1 Tax=Paranoxybacillus vitaminiphilus TaxID=581036 RepID=A0A327YND4_9BACL|nr:DNA polymerase III subunit delta [Anoxybacillus vitaminiphilus]RAK22453.1 DNA polymerase III delta subunit [Anoxybacillus vitaminiphilus]